MILLITGASHTGKTVLAHRLVQRYSYACLSIDHLKMGLIRSGQTSLSPESPDRELTGYLWPIVREMIKTAIENGQDLIIEGCYVPFDWKAHFEPSYLEQIRFLCLAMSEVYIKEKWKDIRAHASNIERRRDEAWLSSDRLASENKEYMRGCLENGLKCHIISKAYPETLDIADFSGVHSSS